MNPGALPFLVAELLNVVNICVWLWQGMWPGALVFAALIFVTWWIFRWSAQ